MQKCHLIARNQFFWLTVNGRLKTMHTAKLELGTKTALNAVIAACYPSARLRIDPRLLVLYDNLHPFVLLL